MKKVAFIDEVHDILKERLEVNGFDCVDFTKLTKTEIDSKINEYTGIVIRSRLQLDEEFLSKATSLKFIARSGAGLENIDLDYCKNKSIELFNAPEGNRNAVGEHALGMLLNLFNNINKGDNEIRNGIWDREGNRGVELEGKTIAIIGYGNNGKEFAKKLRGFDVRIITYDKFLTNYGNKFIEEVNMETIFHEADIISFHIPQNTETIGLVNSAYLNKFSKNIYIINLSRGKIINTLDLMDNIDRGLINGACLDVLEFEKTSFENIFSDKNQLPKSFKRLLESSKVLLSPHVGGWTVQSYFKLSNVLADKILRFYKM